MLDPHGPVPDNTPLNRLTPEARYQRDPQFKTLVDMLEQLLHEVEYTPTELREAIMLAMIHHDRFVAVYPDLLKPIPKE